MSMSKSDARLSAWFLPVEALGMGKKGTLVYSADQLVQRIRSRDNTKPHATLVLVAVRTCAGGAEPRVAAASDARALARLGLDARVALKDVRDEAAARRELAVHALVRGIFRAARKARYCVLHPRICSVEVDGHVLLPMRAMTSTAKAMPPASPLDLLRLAKATLESLRTLHRGGVLHLDVKPENVMVGVTKSHNDYVLGDYDLAAHADDVLDALLSGGGIVAVGTSGYMSPLLLGGRIEPPLARCCRFASHVAAAARRRFGLDLPEGLDEDGWSDLFATQRHVLLTSASRSDASAMLQRADLHSLAVTLHRLLVLIKSPEDDDHARSLSGALIAGLASGVFADAGAARAFLS